MHGVVRQVLQTDVMVKYSPSEIGLACVLHCDAERRAEALSKVESAERREELSKRLDEIAALIEQAKTAVDTAEATRIGKLVSAAQKAHKKAASKKGKKEGGKAKKEKKEKKTNVLEEAEQAAGGGGDESFRIAKRQKQNKDE